MKERAAAIDQELRFKRDKEVARMNGTIDKQLQAVTGGKVVYENQGSS